MKHRVYMKLEFTPYELACIKVDKKHGPIWAHAGFNDATLLSEEMAHLIIYYQKKAGRKVRIEGVPNDAKEQILD